MNLQALKHPSKHPLNDRAYKFTSMEPPSWLTYIYGDIANIH